MVVFFKFPLVDTRGGAEFHTLKLAKHFQGTGSEVKLFTSDKKLLKLFQENNLAAEYVFAGWEPTSKWSLPLWPLTYLIARTKFKQILRQIPDGSTLFLQSLTEKLVLAPLTLNPSPVVKISRRETRGEGDKVKVFFLEHKIPGRSLKLNPLKYKYLKLAENVKLITVSNFAKQEFVKLGVPEKNIEVIYPSVTPSPGAGPPAGEAGRVGKRSPINYTVGMLSRLDPEKGIVDFLKIILPHLARHPDWKILIAGEGKEKKKIERLIKNSVIPAEAGIHLLGFVTDLDDFFSKISVLVYPTKVPESFGMSALDAMSRAVPVVASNLGALPEIIEHGENGFLIDGADEWLPHLEKLQDLNLYQQMSQRARESSAKFSEKSMFNAFDTVAKH